MDVFGFFLLQHCCVGAETNLSSFDQKTHRFFEFWKEISFYHQANVTNGLDGYGLYVWSKLWVLEYLVQDIDALIQVLAHQLL